MNISPLLMKDFYKVGHVHQYPPGTTKVYSNLTARFARDSDITHHVVFGIQYLVTEYLMRQFNSNFFAVPYRRMMAEYQELLDATLGPGIDISHIGRLHNLGFLPIHLKALPEGALCPIGVPCLTITNTHPDFYWLPNFLETLISAVLWPMMTSATIAHRFRRLFDDYAARTSDAPEFVDWQGHDFSMRGMFGMEAAAMSGAGHLLSFTGTDTISAIEFLRDYYYADLQNSVVGGSVPATEHSVMCAGGQDDEMGTYERLLTDVYPTGIVSVVSDTWDYWKVIDEHLPALRERVMARDGKLVIRPDSGDPVENILITVPKLYATFGGTVNSKGYKQLDPHIGLIYGDGINYQRAQAIMAGLAENGFASTNVVLGLGSYTYQYNTRDTLGFAMKATYVEIDGVGRAIFKAPKEDASKRSARGLLGVAMANGEYQLFEDVTPESEVRGALRTVFRNGTPRDPITLNAVRARLRKAGH